ncbi:MAG: DUF502 domain-containing protein [Smithellaceae bacterium]|nr:DUF502 domain-containing protein [Smithellaceae bacterium]
MKNSIKGIFLTGLAVTIPLGLTIYIFIFLINLMDGLFLIIPEKYQPVHLLGVHIPGLGIIFTFILIFICGLITKSYLGDRLVGFGEGLLDRIPVIRSVYQALKHVVNSLVGDKSRTFRQVALVEFPRKGVYSIGFVTGLKNGEVEMKTGKRCVSVFVPTTPNPTSGFLIMIPEEDVTPMDMTVEEAFVLIMSVGIVTPESRGRKDFNRFGK